MGVLTMSMSKPSREGLTTPEAAAMLGVSPMTLIRLRTKHKKKGPPFKRIGGTVRYSVSGLKSWLATPDGGDSLDEETPPCQRTGKTKRNSS